MRFIFITNFYPPLHLGGYELWCQEVAERLRESGHEILVLTSRYHKEYLKQSEPDWVHRDLYLEMDLGSGENALLFFTARKKRIETSLRLLSQHINSFAPDGILIWGMWNLPRILSTQAEAIMPGKVAYYFGDYWPTLPNQFENFWNESPRSLVSFIPKNLLRIVARRLLARETRPEPTFKYGFFCSEFLQKELEDKGLSWENVKVIYGSIDTSLYTKNDGNSVDKSNNKDLSLLYVGRLQSDKGVHTAIEAVSMLVHDHKIESICLQIVGSGDLQYLSFLQDLVQQNGLEPYVHFKGSYPKEKLPEIYEQFDIFLFTSIWQEPFGRVIVEAMSSGCAVIGTQTGGAAEIIKDGTTGLTYQPGNATELTQQIIKLSQSPLLKQQLIENGKQAAVEMFDTTRMVSEIEAALLEI